MLLGSAPARSGNAPRRAQHNLVMTSSVTTEGDHGRRPTELVGRGHPAPLGRIVSALVLRFFCTRSSRTGWADNTDCRAAQSREPEYRDPVGSDWGGGSYTGTASAFRDRPQ